MLGQHLFCQKNIYCTEFQENLLPIYGGTDGRGLHLRRSFVPFKDHLKPSFIFTTDICLAWKCDKHGLALEFKHLTMSINVQADCLIRAVGYVAQRSCLRCAFIRNK